MAEPSSPLDAAVVACNSRLRLRILEAIAHSPGASAHDLSTVLETPRATLSLNLRTLEDAGLVLSSDTSEVRRGRRLRYELDSAAYARMTQALVDMVGLA